MIRTLKNLLTRVLRRLNQLHETSRTRRLLSELNEQQLSDIGVSHADRMAELEKPFWR
ncbi:DUF1127 domain-containing protein [Pseudomonas abieticivorans]|uniref:DUF1127 domain-containing protein n=1 Tax=Pseudomonas abieticivorans TaxID=2931382 RepID=UPI0020C049FC|nr:DUF1127 domain-containing protein [Pseudomonas sp. PIA16]